MKCLSCGEEMRNTIGGCYTCDHCGAGINDGVYRPNNYYPFDASPLFNQGWVCPKCGAVMSPTQSFCLFCSPSQKTEITYGTSLTNMVNEGAKK